MKKWLIASLLILLVITSFFHFRSKSTPKYTYKLAISAMFRNEAPWLKEWLVYHHHVLGVDHFYLYNNESTDNYEEILAPFVEKGIVEVIDWKSIPAHYRDDYKLPSDPPQVGYQLGSLNECLRKRALGKAEWVAVMDLDEFIVPAQGKETFFAMMDKAAKNRIGTIRLFWRVFGTSEIYDLSANDLLTEKMIHRAPDDHPWHKLCKSIHRPEAIKECMLHEAAKLHKKYWTKTVAPTECSIHHYWFRTEKFAAGKRGHNLDSIRKSSEEFNRLEDRTMAQYLPSLKAYL